jgi:hypothetical protein
MLEMMMEMAEMQRLVLETMTNPPRILMVVNIGALMPVPLEILFGGEVSTSSGVYKCRLFDSFARCESVRAGGVDGT